MSQEKCQVENEPDLTWNREMQILLQEMSDNSMTSGLIYYA